MSFWKAFLALFFCAQMLRAPGAGMEDLPSLKPGPGDWPWWRGPTSDNKARGENLPLHWSATSGIKWKSAVPGRGHASPILWGGHIFLATADETNQVLEMLCYERLTGKMRWRKELQRGGFMNKHDKNSHASATAACDGEQVYFPALFNDALWVFALDFEGNIRWKTRVGQFVPSNGYGSSPVLYKSAVIVLSDNVGDSCVVALHRKTGEQLWKTERPKLDNFCTPVLARVSGKDQLLLSGSKMLAGYNPDDGRQIWFAESPTEVTACTMAFDGELVAGGGNVPVREFICVRADGVGNVTPTHLQWRSRKNVTYVPSPLAHEGILYMINDGGIAHAIDFATGEDIYKERLEGEFTASPILAGNRIFATNEKGKTFVMEAGRKFQVVATNDLREAVLATPAPGGDEWIFRSAASLICIDGIAKRAAN